MDLLRVEVYSWIGVADQAKPLPQVRYEAFITCFKVFVCNGTMGTVSICIAGSLTRSQRIRCPTERGSVSLTVVEWVVQTNRYRVQFQIRTRW